MFCTKSYIWLCDGPRPPMKILLNLWAKKPDIFSYFSKSDHPNNQ